MNLAREPIITDDYFVTAHQIFDCCGVESTSTLCVDDLMDKFVPFVKTNMAELSFLKTLLDPDQCNPEINVTNLANALRQYSESHKPKMDLDESFNLRSGQAPQDSDSGISTDGLQLVEDLQCELKEKERLTNHLRSQLDSADRQHEEMTAALSAERDSLRRHLNMLREENATLSHVRRDYDEACDRLCSSGAALDDAKRELETLRRVARESRDKVADLETDIISLQDLLSKSKDECHRINEMYATRQSALLEENETLKSQHATLTSRLQDQDEFMQQVMKEKVLLEMELKDTLNRSNQTHLRLDRSIDVSYTDDQMLTALDSLNADSRFSTDVTSVSIQTEMPCSECEKRKIVPHRSLRRFFWEPLKCLFQVFAVICFLGAISLLYGVSQRGRVRCDRERGVTPWRWFDAQDIMDLLLRIEYTTEVPM